MNYNVIFQLFLLHKLQIQREGRYFLDVGYTIMKYETFKEKKHDWLNENAKEDDK